MTSGIIELKSVSKFYGEVMGLNDVTLRFRKGMTGLLGPNGAGKSTMMKMVTGQIKPSKGQVRVLGLSPWDNPDLNLRLGYCPEQDSFFKSMTGLRFVSFLARMNGLSRPRAEKMAKVAIEKVNMIKDMDRPISQYSKGMRQRIKIAQSLVHDPELLFLNKPLAGTDPIGRKRIIDILFELQKEGRHILISSHVLHEVERLTENIVLIDRGKLVAEGNIHDIRDSLDRFPLTVRIKTENPRDLARTLSMNPEISQLIFQDRNELRIRTTDPNRFFDSLQTLLVRKDIGLESIDSPDDNLNAVFEYLVE